MDTLHLVNSAQEDVEDPLSSSGMSINSFEEGMSGKSRRRSSSTLSKLRKLKKPNTNGLDSGFTPHPPSDKPAWNSPRTIADDKSPLIPNRVGNHDSNNEQSEIIDPFTGEVKITGGKTRKPRKVSMPIEEETVDPFTGQIARTKKKRDPFTAGSSVDFHNPVNGVKPDSVTNKDASPVRQRDPRDAYMGNIGSPIGSESVCVTKDNENTDQFTGEVTRKTRKKRDPFTAINSIDFESSPTRESTDFDQTVTKDERKMRDPFTAMNSINFDENAPGESTDFDDVKHVKEEKKKRDPFTTMNSIDFDGSPTKHNDNTDEQGTTKEETSTPTPVSTSHSMSMNDTENAASENLSTKPVRTSRYRDRTSFLPPVKSNSAMADNETGEQVPKSTGGDGPSQVEGAVSSAPKSNIRVELLDGDELVNSTDTDDLQDKYLTLPTADASNRLSPSQEVSVQEHTESANRLSEHAHRRRSNRSPLLFRENLRRQSGTTNNRFRPIGDGHDQNESTLVKDPNSETGENSEATEIVTGAGAQSLETGENNGSVEIDEDSDSDDLVVIGGSSSSRKPTPVTVSQESPIATSTPGKPVSGGRTAPGDIPRLNLEGVVPSEDEEGGEIYKVSEIHADNSSESEDEASGSDSGSELDEVDPDTLKAQSHAIAGHADVTETETEIVVRRKTRTSPIDSPMGSSELLKKGGRLSPIAPISTPPPLGENYSSSVLRTSYRNDNRSVLSEPLMRSMEELSDTNRSFLSTGALPQISTLKARQMSFLSGGMRNTGSLLGREEMERFFPDRKLRIFVGTWNMCELKVLPHNLKDLLLPEHSEYDLVHDMYVIGTQESTANGSEWEISLQETLGPSHVLLHSATHGVLMLLIFIRRDLIWFCSTVEDDQVSTRPGAMIKTKGAVAAAFTFFGTSFLFINAHFTSGDEHMKDRILDYEKICKGLQLPQKVEVTRKYNVLKDDVTTRFDCVFWCGDFNFRLVESRQKVEAWANQLRNGSKTDYNILLELDQLNRAKNKKEIFHEFREGQIEFVPSYKYDINEDIFDTSEKQRVPSYTDRVLFKSRKKNDIAVLDYMMCDQIKASDHRPVCGVYQVNIRPGKDDMASGAGSFRRDVFIEANKRRAAKAGMSNNVKSQAGSAVCSVM